MRDNAILPVYSPTAPVRIITSVGFSANFSWALMLLLATASFSLADCLR